MKKKQRDNPYADSMAQAATMVGEPLAVLQAAKESGCKAFKHSRVYLNQLRDWIIANGAKVKRAIEAAEAEHRQIMADAEWKEEKVLRARKESIRVTEARRRVVGCITKLKSRLLAIPPRVSQKMSLQTDPIKIEEDMLAEINDALKQTQSDDYANYDCPHCRKRIGN